MSIQKLFPVLLYQKSHLNGNKQLIKDLLHEVSVYSEQDSFGQKWSKKNYPGGYTSYSSLNQMHQLSPTFASLKKILDKEVKTFAQELDFDIEPNTLKLSTLWMNIMPKLTTHSNHIHPLSAISGTFYLQVPPQSAGFKIEDPKLLGFMGSPPRRTKCHQDNARFITLSPKVGDLVLFESWLRHEVPPNCASQERISLSFNYDWLRN